MEKGESMRLEACLPQSWWEFSLEHTTHVYNRTPIHRLSWQTPHEQLNREKPTVDHLWVFGCGAYVYIPAEVRSNKLAPKSELMTYLGNAPGGKGWRFMRTPNNIIFTSAHAIFDEALFPKCPLAVRRPNTRVRTPTPKPSRAPCSDKPSTCGKGKHCHCPPKVDEDEDFPPKSQPSPKSDKGKQREERVPTPPPSRPPTPPPQSPTTPSESEKESEDEEENEKEQAPPPQPTPGPSTRRSGRQPKPRYDKNSIYSKKSGSQVDKMSTREWKKVVGELSRAPKQMPKVLQKSRAPRNVSAPPSTREPSPPEDSETDDFESEGAVEEELLADSDEQISLLKMCQEGGTEAINFLLAKAVSPTATAPTKKSPKEWSYRDLARLNPQELELWRTACTEELNALKKRDIFELVDRPTSRKTIKNRWVFNVKSDGRRKAHLVAKGFSQVEGLDFDQIFSPIVRFETVRLILALAALEGWTISGLDVKSAYLYGTLDEEIYMEQPEGFVDANHPKKVLKLRKALYGLKQAGLAWW